jgi:ABC-type sulfate transport system permease component
LFAALVALAALISMSLAFGYREISSPILVRVDRIAVADSVRWEVERAARIAGDNKAEEKLDIIIGLLRGGRRGR